MDTRTLYVRLMHVMLLALVLAVGMLVVMTDHGADAANGEGFEFVEVAR